MSWQEELRRLDSELAAGRIEHAEHRRRREELLAEASGSGAVSPTAAPPRPSAPEPPATSAAAGSWHAEPVRWDDPTPSPAPTSFFAPNTLNTPVAPTPATGTPHTWTSANPAIPPPEPPTRPEPPAEDTKPERPPRSPLTRKARWDPSSGDKSFATAPSPADVNPTGFLPVTGDTNDRPPQQPPELRQLWEAGPPVKKRPTWLFLSLGVLVVLALIVGVIWYAGSRPDASDRADTVSAPPVPPAAGNPDPAASLEDKLPRLAGTPGPANSTMSVDKAVQLKLVSQADADLMKSAAASELVYHAYADAAHKNNGTTVIAVPVPSPAQATQLVAGLRKNLTAGGFTTSPLGPAPTDLLYSASSPAGRVLAYWYTSGPVAIGIGVSEPLSDDAAALKSRIEQIREKVAAALPAG